MNRRKKIILAGGFILLAQLICFRDYIIPVQWGQIKISGMACTCPDETVTNGQWYLWSITPDSLKKYDLDYSEIYVSERPFTDDDPMGTDLYIIKGRVVGKERVSEVDSWNPKVKIESWHKVNIIYEWLIKGLFFLQLIVLGAMLLYTKKFSYRRSSFQR